MPINPILLDSLLFFITAYFLFPRQFNNFFVAALRPNDYVVVHMRRTLGKKVHKFFVIPNSKDNYFTRITKKQSYDLAPNRYNFIINGRKHYIINEWDFMPTKYRIVPFLDRLKGVSTQEPDPENYHPTDFKVTELKEEIVFRDGGKLYFKCDDQCVPLKLDPRTDDDYVIGSKRVDAGQNAKQMRIFSEGQNPLFMILLFICIAVVAIIAIYGISKYQELSPLVQTIYQDTIINRGNLTISPKP